MIILLFIGAIAILFLLCAGLFCCFFGKELFTQLSRVDGSSERRGAELAAGLGGLIWNPEEFKHLDSCLICLVDF